MIRSKTVFVVGAGASCELGFPSGAELLQNIATDLDIRFEHWDQKSGSRVIMEAFRRHHAANDPQSDVNDYLKAGWRLRDAANITRSIDNALDQNAGNPKVEFAGKLAIASQIRDRERESHIQRRENHPNIIDINRIRDSWIFYLGQILTTDVRSNKIDSIFENVTFISFNYDRSLEACLPTILCDAYGVGLQDADNIVQNAKIYHPYGYLGNLPSSSHPQGVAFWNDTTDIIRLSQSIKTFGEEIHQSPEIDDMRGAMLEADQIVFLGFGFHKPNIKLISPLEGLTARAIYGTVFQEPSAAIATIKQDIAKMAIGNMPNKSRYDVELAGFKCFEFLKQYYSPLTS